MEKVTFVDPQTKESIDFFVVEETQVNGTRYFFVTEEEMMICQLQEMVKHGAASSIMRTGSAIKRTKEALRQRHKQRSGSVTSGNSREKIWILTLRILLKSISLMWRTGLEKAQSRIKDMCLI